MATTLAAHVSLEEYLNTTYEPDCDYVDGVLEDRNVGKKKHSRTQARVCAWLSEQLQTKGKEALTEQRVRLSASRIRIPDVCVVDADDDDEVQQKLPSLWVEVLSPDDRLNHVQKKLQELLHFGVPTVWLVDPYERRAWTGTGVTGLIPVDDSVLRCKNLKLELKLEEVIG